MLIWCALQCGLKLTFYVTSDGTYCFLRSADCFDSRYTRICAIKRFQWIICKHFSKFEAVVCSNIGIYVKHCKWTYCYIFSCLRKAGKKGSNLFLHYCYGKFSSAKRHLSNFNLAVLGNTCLQFSSKYINENYNYPKQTDYSFFFFYI